MKLTRRELAAVVSAAAMAAPAAAAQGEEQAVRQFEIWTGDSAPRAVMQKAALEALEHK